MADTLTITAVARRAALRPSALRYYESVGLLPAPERVGNRRRYGPDVLSRLTLIAAQQMGFSSAEIAVLIDGFAAGTPAGERWSVMAAQKLAEVEALIVRAEGMRQLLGEALRCQCLTLDACARAFQARGCSTAE